ncbi:alpha/beta hydrolase [Clostridium botulinum]|uniref:Alpha/beta hydrolase n=1 Tax=Clostridium botulinum TaxID=1491 RepID=A0A846KH77_CLOBO|nr:alpha/beta hydrolase [Clostridium botulinum]EES48957.1 alpha/beta hydrolase family protein [Clostridium botulinum E1 str. 'BoNT E Beluga']MBY6760165.1 alpha/beta hydrolase [Clostridium botulinum]MBY6919074.1 alpha/beta hydrolase [Clostridium botulinum]MCR1132203.1 alpha/beta hydrolase [Clostridium botulinum]NFL52741.1 alpha/beta hydrolase [Clostridium botulinum]
MKEYIVDNENNKMRYHDLPGKDTTILFIHGLGCAGSFDYPEVAAQTDLIEHRRILIDLIGSGFSDKPDNYLYTVKEHANYLYNFVQDLKLNKFIIFAHSLGGPIALELADKCIENIETIILSESNLDKSSQGTSSYEFGTCQEEDFVNYIFDEVVNENTIKNSMWAATLSVCSSTAISRISKSAVVEGDPSWREILYSLQCKRTFIFGEKSLPDDDKIELERRMINIEIVKSAGHSMAWENPKGLAESIKKGILYARQS